MGALTTVVLSSTEVVGVEGSLDDALFIVPPRVRVLDSVSLAVYRARRWAISCRVHTFMQHLAPKTQQCAR